MFVNVKRWLLSIAVACVWLDASASAEAQWITHSKAPAADSAGAPIALQFRRELTLESKPKGFRVRVSADQRFVLFVNEQRVIAGPARGHLGQWRYESVDLAPFLEAGANVVAVQVWSDGKAAALAQITSGRTAFWLSAESSEHDAIIGSGSAWLVRVDRSRTVEPAKPQIASSVGPGFYAAGPPETIDASMRATDWAARVSSAAGWTAAVPATPSEGSAWTLIADALPPMRHERVNGSRVARARGVAADNFPGNQITVAPDSEAAIVIDAGRMLSAYPVLIVSGGAGANVEATYTEALYDPNSDPATKSRGRTRFADRSTVADGLVLGLTDTFKPDGALRRLQPFWWRTWRFVEIKVKTSAEPLTLHDFETWETGYPFEQRGRFVSSDPELDAIWRIGWNTARINAHETYMDSSYWEQLQYIGDTRIQMLLSYDVAGDARLAVQALDAFDQSRVVEGLPQSAWPSTMKQVIPPFALLWIGSLHDYWMRQPDPSVLRRTLGGTRDVLAKFARHVEATGMVGPMPGWPFVDWMPGLDGWAYRAKGVRSCIITMQYIGALREAADLERALGDKARADEYLAQADRSANGVNAECWDEMRGLYADTPEKERFSQHGNALAVLYDIAPVARHRSLLDRVTVRGRGIDAPESVTGTSYYFSFYLARAFEHAGLADRYFELLESWRTLVHRNFTSWPETPDPSRSDTHAWSAHPTSGLTEYVAGIKPDAPGFERVRIEPHLGTLTSLDAAVAHPRGQIETKYSVRNGRLSAVITLPEGVTGQFAWQGQSKALQAGRNNLRLRLRPGS